MGEKYDRYLESKENLDQARKDLGVAQGGSTRDHMQQTQANLSVSQQAEAISWNEFIQDPEG